MDFTSTNFDLPENLFYFHKADLGPLTFVLDWDTDDKFYYNLLLEFTAEVLDAPDAHSLVLTKPDKTTYFHPYIPAFDIKYIEDCFRIKDFPDPTKYLIKETCLMKYSKDQIFDCWYHNKISWSSLETIKKNTICDDDSEISEIESFSYKKRHNQLNSDSDDCLLKTKPFTSSSSVSSYKKTRLPYSHKEDVQIVKYIVQHNHAFNIAGRQMWQQMERANVCKIRSWQSMKERYLKHIKHDLTTGIYKYPFLKAEDLKLLRQGLGVDVIRERDGELLKSKYLNMHTDNSSSD